VAEFIYIMNATVTYPRPMNGGRLLLNIRVPSMSAVSLCGSSGACFDTTRRQIGLMVLAGLSPIDGLNPVI